MKTIEEVDGMGLKPADRSIVLEALLRARLSPSSSTSATHAEAGSTDKPLVQPAEQGDVLGKLAHVLNLPKDTLELVYDVVDDGPALVVSAKKIATNKSQGMRQLAQLISAARQISGIEEWTSAGLIRKVAQDYGRLDGSNFAASLQLLEDVAVLRGKGASREVKITKPGIEATSELIRTITGNV
ncbi:hypothetical protein ACFSBZ_08540 [Amnibacterium flavum]|uniref:Uncharacterized protein n=1 Tax=Amnibacterium flavum TaxID=2173173 RepID=A0A2V1HQF8_9MICO|nr:hypothetical protein [Amnibacterium flavum]PVZ93359.1 hypothetical protein DDQ50_15385 [Amnibacterium flavum]